MRIFLHILEMIGGVLLGQLAKLQTAGNQTYSEHIFFMTLSWSPSPGRRIPGALNLCTKEGGGGG